MIKGIIFDLGGVCLSDVPLVEISQNLSQVCSLSEDEIHDILYTKSQLWTELTLGKISEDQYWEGFLKLSKINTPKEELKAFVRESLKLNDHTVEIIQSLNNDYKLAILSNHVKEWVKYLEERYSFFFDLFSIQVFSCNIRLRKPDPQIYEATLKELNLNGEECIFIDDKERNTKKAKELGIKTIIFRSSDQLKNELLNLEVNMAG